MSDVRSAWRCMSTVVRPVSSVRAVNAVTAYGLALEASTVTSHWSALSLPSPATGQRHVIIFSDHYSRPGREMGPLRVCVSEQ